MSRQLRLKSKNSLQPDFSIVVCAGGKSSRFRAAGGGVSKQLIVWQDKPLFLHTLHCFRALPPKELALVVPSEEISQFEKRLENESFPFPIRLTTGGARRQDSVRAGLQALQPVDYVGIHDGARPFLSAELLQRLTSEVRTKLAVIPGLPVVETVKEFGPDSKVVRTVDRNCLMRVQTPQFFKFDMILKVHEHFANSSREFTDDSMMCEELGYSVFVCEGEAENLKVTIPSDLQSTGVLAC